MVILKITVFRYGIFVGGAMSGVPCAPVAYFQHKLTNRFLH